MRIAGWTAWVQDRCDTGLYAVPELQTAAHESGELHQKSLHRWDEYAPENPQAGRKMREVKWRENAGTGAVRRDPPGNADGDVEAAGRGLSRMAGWQQGNHFQRKEKGSASGTDAEVKGWIRCCMGRQEERSAGGTGCEERIRIQGAGSNLGEQERNRTSECRSSRIGRTDEGREEKSSR